MPNDNDPPRFEWASDADEAATLRMFLEELRLTPCPTCSLPYDQHVNQDLGHLYGEPNERGS